MSVPMTRCQDKVSCCKYDIWVNYILLSLIFLGVSMIQATLRKTFCVLLQKNQDTEQNKAWVK